jgi:hypothetical protein
MLNVFVGCSANNEDLESLVVFKHRVEQLTHVPVNLVWMYLSKDPSSPFYSDGAAGWQTKPWATPFSGFRWAIPSVMNYEGRAAYFDSDFIPMASLEELFLTPLAPGQVMAAKGGNRYCSILWDCAAAKGHVPHYTELMRNEKSHAAMMTYFARTSKLVKTFSPEMDWNVLDLTLPPNLADSKVKAIHYTQLHKQLHYKYAMPRLKAEGGAHWYKGNTEPHHRMDLQGLFDFCYLQAGGPDALSAVRNAAPFGAYSIRGV